MQQIILYQLSGSIILKKNQSIEISHDIKPTEKSTQQGRIYYGLLGIIKLVNTYAFLIKEQSKIGQIRNCSIYKVITIEAINCTKMELSGQQIEQETYCLEGIQQALSNLYYSIEYDLTMPLAYNTRHISTLTPGKSSDIVCNDFWFNHHISLSLMEYPEFRLKAICGFVELKSISLSHQSNSSISSLLGLISRKYNKRGGTRYHSRGIDSNGDVSNCVETEQFCLIDKDWQSHLQVRGSIPLFWKHTITGAYAPLMQIHDPSSVETKEAYLKHYQWLHNKYGSLTFVNLVDQKGKELLLSQGFAKQLLYTPDVNYIAFDFHKECSKLRWHRLSLLLDQLKKNLDNYSYFELM